MSEAMNATMNFPRRDARDKLRGRTRYTVDRVRPAMLHAALTRAQVPAARILRIDISAARKMPGVRAILRRGDLAPIAYITPDFGNSLMVDEPRPPSLRVWEICECAET